MKLVTFERTSRFIFGDVAKYKSSAPLKLGNISLGGTPVAITQYLIGGDHRVTVILGLDILTMFDVELDLAHHKINLFAKDHCPGKVIYWTKNAGVASVPMKFYGR